MIRDHVLWSEKTRKAPRGRLRFPRRHRPMLSLFSFRHEPKNIADLDAITFGCSPRSTMTGVSI